MAKIIIDNDKYFKRVTTEIFPTNSQKELIDRSLELSRYVYNWVIEKEKEQYELFKLGKSDLKFLDKYKLSKLLTEYKKSNQWLYDVPSATLRGAIERAVDAYIRFFKGQNGYPKFKSKKSNKSSYRSRTDRTYFEDNLLRIEGLPRNEKVYTKYHTKLSKNDKIYSIGIIKEYNKYYVSYVLIENKPNKNTIQINKNIGAIGIDLNIDKRFMLSNGDVYKEPNLDKLESSINKLQRIYKRKRMKKEKVEISNLHKNTITHIPYSNRDIKLRTKLRKKYQKLHNIKENFIQQTTSKIIKMNPTAIVMENLCVEDMKRKRSISKQVIKGNFFRCKQVMKQKCNMYNIPFIEADRHFPSSQICSECGFKHKTSKRIFKCPNCSIIIDRDLNAAINLERLAYL